MAKDPEYSNLGTFREQVQCLTNENFARIKVFSRSIESPSSLTQVQLQDRNERLYGKILDLENRILEIELRDERTTGERDALQERLRTLENDHKELGNEYLALKSNYLVLDKEHEQEVSKNEELSRELLNLVKSKQEHPHHLQTKSTESQSEAEEPSAEVKRVRTLVHRLSARKVKPEDVVVASEQERQKLEKSLLGNQGHITEEMEKMREMYNSQQQKLEERMLQLQLKELNEEYRSRLVQYITDLAEYTDSKSSPAKKEPSQMKHFVDSMLKDIRASYKSREEQLARAARGYKKRMQNLVKKHEGLLIAYRMQREQIRLLGSHDLDPGPPEHHFSITDAELLTNTSQELNRLREDKANLEGQLYELQMKGEGWAQLRKQLREFTHSTQVELERERSQLLARAMVAEEQVAELQEYVDKHLVRYKQEIVKMRKLLGTNGSQALSAEASE
ncbi:Coiled-coil domain-containing protein 78, partial [Ophiophagus hannah]